MTTSASELSIPCGLLVYERLLTAEEGPRPGECVGVGGLDLGLCKKQCSFAEA